MRVIEGIFPERVLDALGWTIVHSLWQGALLALILAVIIIMLRRSSSRIRYLAGSIGLVLMLLLAIGTFFLQVNANSGSRSLPGKMVGAVNTSDSAPIAFNESGNRNGSENIGPLAKVISFFESYCRNNLPLIVTIWMLGFFIQMLRFLGGFAYQQRLKVCGSQPVSSAWQKKFSRLGRKVGLKKTVRYLESKLAKTPLVIGFIKPVILFPIGLITSLPSQQVEALLLHELAHILRRDYLINLLQSLVDIIFFYHPAVWWISSFVRSEREKCCDDMALSHMDDSMSFARALTHVHEAQPKGEKLALAFNNNKHQVLLRIKRLFQSSHGGQRANNGFVVVCTLFICAALAVSLYTGGVLGAQKSGETEIVENFSFNNIKMKDVMLYFAKKYKYSLVIDSGIGDLIVTFNQKGLTWKQALNKILDQHGLAMVRDKDQYPDLVRIMTKQRQIFDNISRNIRRQKFSEEAIDMQFFNMDLRNVLESFRKISGTNFIIDQDIKGKVTVEFKGIPWDQALDYFLDINGLKLVLENNQLWIKKLKPGEKSVRIYSAKKYTGERIDVNFKDKDLIEAVMFFSENPGKKLGLNIVIDPQFPQKFKVTINKENIPWDRALDLILHGAGWELDLNGKLLRIKIIEKISETLILSPKNLLENITNMQFAGEKVSFDFMAMRLKNIMMMMERLSNIKFEFVSGTKANVNCVIKDIPWDEAQFYFLYLNDLKLVQKGNLLEIQELSRSEKTKKEKKRRKLLAKKDGFKGAKGDFDFNELNLHKVLKYLHNAYKVNIFIEPGTNYHQNIITYQKNNIRWDMAFSEILDQANLKYYLDGKILIITKK